MSWRGIKSISCSIPCTVLLFFVLASYVNADIYMYIDEKGVMHFTNAPTSSSDREYKVYIRERSSISTRYTTEQYDELISDAAARYEVSVPLLKAIIKAESDFNPRAISKKGAMGLMQIMPDTIKDLEINNPFDPRENIMGGTRYFKQLYDRFNGKLSLSLAAYNAGPTVVDQYKNIPPYRETEEYVERVLKYYYRFNNL
jgi:soluble lytic murein transglycosylase-like protein